LFRHLDEQKLVDSLPRYVSADPDMMPSIRLFEGNMNVIMIMLEKLGHKFEEYGSALSTITRDVSALQSKFVSYVFEFLSDHSKYSHVLALSLNFSGTTNCQYSEPFSTQLFDTKCFVLLQSHLRLLDYLVCLSTV